MCVRLKATEASTLRIAIEPCLRIAAHVFQKFFSCTCLAPTGVECRSCRGNHIPLLPSGSLIFDRICRQHFRISDRSQPTTCVQTTQLDSKPFFIHAPGCPVDHFACFCDVWSYQPNSIGVDTGVRPLGCASGTGSATYHLTCMVAGRITPYTQYQ